MLKKEVLEAQVTFELPAREMLAFANFALIGVNQNNYNLQLGALNVNALQANQATVTVVQL